MPRTSLRLLALLVVSAVLSSCGSNNDTSSGTGAQSTPASSAASSSAASSATTAASASPSAADTGWTLATPTISPQASAVFGADQAQAGTQAVVAFAQEAFYDDACMSTVKGQNVDGCAYNLLAAMNPEAQKFWRHAVTGFLRDKSTSATNPSQDTSNVRSISFYGAVVDGGKNANGKTVKPNPDGTTAIHRTLTNVSTTVATDGRLQVDVAATADIRVLVNRQPKLLAFDRTATFWMVNTSDGWKIDGWHGSWKPGKKYLPDNT